MNHEDASYCFGLAYQRVVNKGVKGLVLYLYHGQEIEKMLHFVVQVGARREMPKLL